MCIYLWTCLWLGINSMCMHLNHTKAPVDYPASKQMIITRRVCEEVLKTSFLFSKQSLWNFFFNAFASKFFLSTIMLKDFSTKIVVLIMVVVVSNMFLKVSSKFSGLAQICTFHAKVNHKVNNELLMTTLLPRCWEPKTWKPCNTSLKNDPKQLGQ